MEVPGLEEVRKVSEWHDEPLRGKSNIISITNGNGSAVNLSKRNYHPAHDIG
ncbi:MAG: hypothetical protein KAJ00_06670 [Deltaproteobacteria bacterium]|nr:hypothetical protein [Deltaproteobacteria bacterium]